MCEKRHMHKKYNKSTLRLLLVFPCLRSVVASGMLRLARGAPALAFWDSEDVLRMYEHYKCQHTRTKSCDKQ